ncbi:MAG: SET domain-containing protein-lysine N-methyltransferase [Polyangiaceae bacterium]|nr:SET domain-containing protein-lysine N-methyltransferase [Polyangiaceae bacterium]
MSTSALIDWAVSRGATLSGVTVDHHPQAGRLLRATEHLPADQEVLRVPPSALLSLEVARRSPAGQAILSSCREMPPASAFLTAYLLSEKKKSKSAIQPYLDALPSAFPTVPLFCPQDVLPYLRGSLVSGLVVKRRDAVLREVLELRRTVPALRDATVAELFWASTVVITRVFGITVRGSATEALVPIADMMNHKRPPDVSWTFDDASDAFVIRTVRDIAAGEEVCGSYGRKANHRYFVHYGFALPSGADDEAELVLTMPPNAPNAAAKSAGLRRAFGTESNYRICSRVRVDATQRTLSFFRTACAIGSETGRALRFLRDGDLVPPLSHRNEAAALSMLHTACGESLSRFDSPHESEDESILERTDLPIQVRHAVVVRRGEKRLLHAWRRLTDTAVDMLRTPRKTFFARAVNHRGEGLVTSYLTDVAMALAPKDARRISMADLGL